MYHLLSQVLFYLYWTIAAVTGALLVREILREADWKTQATAVLAVIPFLLRAFLLK
jgi:predicted branched-subunit amino acid permease